MLVHCVSVMKTLFDKCDKHCSLNLRFSEVFSLILLNRRIKNKEVYTIHSRYYRNDVVTGMVMSIFRLHLIHCYSWQLFLCSKHLHYWAEMRIEPLSLGMTSQWPQCLTHFMFLELKLKIKRLSASFRSIHYWFTNRIARLARSWLLREIVFPDSEWKYSVVSPHEQ